MECSFQCVEFEEEICTKYNVAPHVCNGCEVIGRCPLSKWVYDAYHAHNHYGTMRSESRKGISIDEQTLEAVDNIISPLLKRGQSVRSVCIRKRDEIMLSEKTIYRYISMGLLTADKFDLKRTVQRRTRKKSGVTLLVDKGCRVNRTYNDYTRFMKDNDNPSVVQMDTVEGKKGGKVILTLYFCSCNLQLGFLRDRNTSASVTAIFRELLTLLGAEMYKKLFPVILTDRGSEFSDPEKIEMDTETGEILSNVFYCDPQNSNQKAECEKNHEYIRYIIPKGKSLDNRTKEDVALMMNNINSTGRKSLNDKCPMELFEMLYRTETMKKLGLSQIRQDLITLTPELFRIK